MEIEEIKEIIKRENFLARKINELAEKHSKVDAEEQKSIKENIKAISAQIKDINDKIPGFFMQLEVSKPLQVQENNPIEKIQVLEKKIKKGDEKFEELGIERETLKRQKKDLIIKEKKKVNIKPSFYVKISNRFFSNMSEKLIKSGNFENVRENLIRAKMQFLINSYVSVIFFSTLLVFLASIFIWIGFLFYDLSITSPFILRAQTSIATRMLNFLWILFAPAILTFIFMYFYPSLERGYLGGKIDEELPFVTIHMNAIAGSHIEPSQIFKILAMSDDYPFTKKEMVSLINKVNVYGYNLAGALRDGAKKSPSKKLQDLFNGLATNITSGGSLENFLAEKTKGLLFEYKLEQERKNKSAETFMDIYISIVIAAPMIFMLLLVLVNKTGFAGGFSVGMLTLIIISIVSLINIVFLIVLHLKQPQG